MTEQPQKNDKTTLFGLVNAAQAMIDSITAPEKKEPEAPAPTPVPKPKSVMQKMEEEARFKERHAIMETAALQLLVELRSKGLLASGETVAIKLETENNHQYITLKAEIEKSLQR